jgi:hypothetical protein
MGQRKPLLKWNISQEVSARKTKVNTDKNKYNVLGSSFYNNYTDTGSQDYIMIVCYWGN